MPVLVTGATGFIASRIVELLLAHGYRVRGTVRSVKRSGDIEALRQLRGAAERLELVEADLTRAGSFDAPATGCGVVMHTASPYALNVEDPKRDLIDPAVDGTRSVLNASARAGSVARVVLTSSMAAITDEPEGDHVLTEADWNMKSSLVRNPYYLSKTLAEKAAWAFIEHQQPSFDLVAVNPFMVIGPSLVASLNTSNQIFVELLTGRFPGVLDLTWGFVDVRDVAEAHLRAMERPGAHGRYICAAETASMRTVVDLLRTHGYNRYRLPKIPLDSPFGNWVVRQFSYRQGEGVGSYLRTHLGRVPRYDTTKIRTELGLTFRPIEQTVLETVQDLERWGHLDKAVG